MGFFNNRDDLRREKRNINILFFWILVLLLVVSILINVVMGGYTWKSLYVDFFNALIGIMIPLVLFNIVFEYFTKTNQNREMSDTIAETLMANKELIDRFSIDSKKEFIKNSTRSILGEVNGQMLYETLIQPYLNHKYNFRRNFKYYISYSDRIVKGRNDYIEESFQSFFINQNYYWVGQELSFLRHLNHLNLENREILVGFSYEESTLDALYNRHGFLFRENLWLTGEHIELLNEMGLDDMDRFVAQVLQFQLELNGEKIEGRVIHKGEDGFHLVFNLPNSLLLEIDREYKFKFNFRMPQLKTQKKFIVVISEPTYQVEVLFSHIQSQVDVTTIPFFDDSNALTYLPNETVKINLDKWVLPRAGVVFVWDEVEEATLNHELEESHSQIV